MVKEIMNVKSKELISTEDDDTSDVEVETKKTAKRPRSSKQEEKKEEQDDEKSSETSESVELEKKKHLDISFCSAILNLFGEFMKELVNKFNEMSYISQLGVIFGFFSFIFFMIVFYFILKKLKW